MTKEEIVAAIGNATNGTYIPTNHTFTLMGGIEEYDEQGRIVSVDPNYKHGTVNICGTEYAVTRVGWNVYIWKPEYAGKASYTWVWLDDRDNYLLDTLDLMPDYVREYKARKAEKELEYKKKFVKEGEVVVDLVHLDDSVYRIITFEQRFAQIQLKWIHEKEWINDDGTKVVMHCSSPAEQTWENILDFKYVMDTNLRYMKQKLEKYLPDPPKKANYN